MVIATGNLAKRRAIEKVMLPTALGNTVSVYTAPVLARLWCGSNVLILPP